MEITICVTLNGDRNAYSSNFTWHFIFPRTLTLQQSNVVATQIFGTIVQNLWTEVLFFPPSTCKFSNGIQMVLTVKGFTSQSHLLHKFCSFIKRMAKARIWSCSWFYWAFKSHMNKLEHLLSFVGSTNLASGIQSRRPTIKIPTEPGLPHNGLVPPGIVAVSFQYSSRNRQTPANRAIPKTTKLGVVWRGVPDETLIATGYCPLDDFKLQISRITPPNDQSPN